VITEMLTNRSLAHVTTPTVVSLDERAMNRRTDEAAPHGSAPSATLVSAVGGPREIVRFGVALTFCALLGAVGCHKETGRSDSFVQSLRCGMTRADLQQLARMHGYDNSDRGWLMRSATDRSRGSKELSLVDLTFRGGRLVAYREGRFVPRTRRIQYRNVDLCGAVR
jgi:hypothetical protein